jgi:hypothetical protein
MNIMDIQKGKTFYHIRITRSGQIYELNEVNIDAIRGNIECIFQIKYTLLNSYFIPYKIIYERLYIEESNSPYFIKMGGEEYLTLPNKQALMKAVRAQVTRYSTYPQSKPRTVINYRDSMKRIKQLH